MIVFIGVLAIGALSLLLRGSMTLWEWLLMLAFSYAIGIMLIFLMSNWFGIPIQFTLKFN